VDVAYALPNLAPQIKGIKIIATPDAEARPQGVPFPPNAALAQLQPQPQPQPPGHTRIIAWESSDPNSDTLEYTLHFRNGSRGPWILLQDKLKDPQYVWDTRSVADGRYQIRVTASDAKANPRGDGRSTSRVSDPVVVDNTAPIIGDLKSAVTGKTVRIDARLYDRTSSIANMEYSLDSKDDWQATTASDNIFDSPEEAVSFTLEGLAPGAHQIMLRATDEFGNQAYETVNVTIEQK
jgi:hypothetical protein